MPLLSLSPHAVIKCFSSHFIDPNLYFVSEYFYNDLGIKVEKGICRFFFKPQFENRYNRHFSFNMKFPQLQISFQEIY